MKRDVLVGYGHGMYVVTAMIKMYAKCACMSEARRLFDSLHAPDMVCWNTLLLGYAENGEGAIALDLFTRMKNAHTPNSVTYVAALKACASIDDGLQLGRQMHAEAACHLNLYVQNTLIDMYSRFRSMQEARAVFDSLHNPDVVSWNNLIMGYAENGEGLSALELFSTMSSEHGCIPDPVTYVAALKACISLALNGAKEDGLNRGREIHQKIGAHLDAHLRSTLIDMYAKCGSLADARRVFEGVRNPDVVSWNAMLLGYAEAGQGRAALDLFSTMIGCRPNFVTYVLALKACVSLAENGKPVDALRWGKQIHMQIGNGRDVNLYAQNTLVVMYCKCGDLAEARNVFENIPKPDVVSWNALILGYAENGEGMAALEMFSRMKASEACTASSITYLAALKACASLSADGDDREYALEQGRMIHSEIGCCSSQQVQNTLIDMYAKCAQMTDARRVFDSIEKPDVVSWNALLLGYAENGEGKAALDLFRRMKATVEPDYVTHIAILKACTALSAKGQREAGLERGREMHLEIGSCETHPYVLNTLILMYAKCGSLAEARRLFDSIKAPELASWNALLSGYADCGEGNAVLDLFATMQSTNGCSPDVVTYIAVLKACALVGALALGRKIHSGIAKFTPQLVTGLVDFYAKCGSLKSACEVFDIHCRERELASFTALIAGYARFGDSGFVLSLFEALQDARLQPDAVTFVCVLLCCSHAGLVGKARSYLGSMQWRYGVTPDSRHYGCMVDVLGRANQLKEATEVIQGMPCAPDAVTWMTLLGACHKWKNVEIGTLAFNSLLGMEMKNAPAYVLMSQIYGSCGMREEQERVLEMKGVCEREREREACERSNSSQSFVQG